MKKPGPKRIIWMSLLGVVLVFLFFFISGGIKRIIKSRELVVWETQPVSDIVLINLGEGDRTYIAEVINQIRTYQPKAIGVNILFKKFDPEKSADTLLKSALSCPEVCILTKHQGIGTYGVDKRFLASSKY